MAKEELKGKDKDKYKEKENFKDKDKLKEKDKDKKKKKKKDKEKDKKEKKEKKKTVFKKENKEIVVPQELSVQMANPADMTPLSDSLKKYLIYICEMSVNKEKCTVTGIAGDMGISKPSVNKAVANLIDRGYVEHQRYGNIILTPKGEELGKEYLKKVAILRAFLADVIGISEQKAHHQAQNMALCLDDETVNKIYNYINNL